MEKQRHIVSAGHVVANRSGTGTPAHQRYAFGVTAKSANVLVHPAQSHSLVQQTHVASYVGRRNREKAKRCQTIVDGNDNDVLRAKNGVYYTKRTPNSIALYLLDEIVRSTQVFAGPSGIETATVNPNQDGQPRLPR